MLECGCCETVGAYIGRHLDPEGTLRHHDAPHARWILLELDRVFAASCGAGVTVEELTKYCNTLDA